MYQIGQKVVYGIHGICRITDREERAVDRRRLTYLVLEPLEQEGARYLVPTHNPAAMARISPLLSREALLELVTAKGRTEFPWISDDNCRKQTYRELMGGGDRSRLVGMIRSLYRHKHHQMSIGRKVHLCDENFLRDAENLLGSEIAEVLDLSSDEAKEFLREKLKEDA